MKNYIQDGKILNVVAAADVLSGTPAKLGSAFGVYMDTKKSGEVVPFCVHGVVEIPKDTTVVAGFGTLIYWDDTNKKATITVGSNTKIGYAVEAAATGDSTAKVKLVPVI